MNHASPATQSLATPLPRTSSSYFMLCAIAAIAYYLLIVFNYLNVIAIDFNYLGFISNPVPFEYFFADIPFIVIPLLSMSLRANRPSDVGVSIIYIIMYIPIIAVLNCLAGNIDFKLFLLKSAAMMSMICVSLGRKLVPINSVVPEFDLPPCATIGILLMLALGAVAIIGKDHGFSLRLHSLTSVYDQRDEFKAISSGARLYNFCNGILQTAITPTLVAIGLTTRRYYLIVIGLFISLYIFSITGSKSAFMTPVYIVATYVAIRYFRPTFLFTAMAVCFGIVSVGWIFKDNPLLSIVNALFVRRILAMQGLLYYYYYVAFDEIGPQLLRHSILSFLGPASVSDPEEYIGTGYFNVVAGGSTHANANFMADGFLNGGYWGVPVAGLCCGVYLGLIDLLSKRMTIVFAVTACSVVFEVLTQTGLIKAMGSHGGITVLLILLFAPFTGHERRLGDGGRLSNSDEVVNSS